ncbi:MAG: peptidoglycan-binding protein [Phyllobacteriaceae bacterium]|nr:peptidoglycan-binding protein [Phyllobacteriaceae bacterium]
MTKSARPTTRTWDDAPSPRGASPGSLPIRLAETVVRHPVTSGGALLSVVTIGVIVGNALANQPLRHPHPWFQTRAPIEDARPVAVPMPQPQPAIQPATLQNMPVAPTPALPPVLPRPRPLGSADSIGTLRDLQVALHDHGLYAGPLDGVLGPATADAIRAFERRIGAPVTGEPSDLLLATARALRPNEPTTTASTPAAPTSAPKRADGAPQRRVEAAPVLGTRSAALDTTPVSNGGTPSMRIAVADAVAHPAASTADDLPMVDEVEAPVFTGSIRRAAREPLASGGDVRLQRIQRGLIAAGYGPLKADGRWDDRCASAVRRFEADNGWPVTGRPTAQLASRLPPDPAPTRH